ncbi:hypothetical protein B0H13DRAFT_1879882 [Mycena leptocephala]|nr:hypothetical protein B0H13DRAFT_1879882 [Mycena leptocephala]
MDSTHPPIIVTATTPKIAGASLIPTCRAAEEAHHSSVIVSTTASSACLHGVQHTLSTNMGAQDVAKQGLWQIRCNGRGCLGPLTRGEEYSAVHDSGTATRAENSETLDILCYEQICQFLTPLHAHAAPPNNFSLDGNFRLSESKIRAQYTTVVTDTQEDYSEMPELQEVSDSEVVFVGACQVCWNALDIVGTSRQAITPSPFLTLHFHADSVSPEVEWSWLTLRRPKPQ